MWAILHSDTTDFERFPIIINAFMNGYIDTHTLKHFYVYTHTYVISTCALYFQSNKLYIIFQLVIKDLIYKYRHLCRKGDKCCILLHNSHWEVVFPLNCLLFTLWACISDNKNYGGEDDDDDDENTNISKTLFLTIPIYLTERCYRS